MKPLFRWAGSKRKLLPELTQFIPKEYEKYAEPFCGSACLYFIERPKLAILSDANYELMHAYSVVRDFPSEVHERVSCIKVDKDSYMEVRSLSPDTLDVIDRAARFIYLNRFCFNGIYRTNRDGKFNVPMGSKTGKIPSLDKFHEYADELKGVELLCCDFEETIGMLGRRDFMYIDPPYTDPRVRQRGEYGPESFNYHELGRLIRVIEEADSRGVKFVLSYSCCDLLKEILPDCWSRKEINVDRNIASKVKHRKVAKELIVFNF